VKYLPPRRTAFYGPAFSSLLMVSFLRNNDSVMAVFLGLKPLPFAALFAGLKAGASTLNAVFRIHQKLSRVVLPALFLCLITMMSAFAQSGEDEVTPQVQELYGQAKAAQQRGDHAGAMLKLAPHLAPAYNNLGMLLFTQRDYAQAAKVLEQGLKLNPDMPTASAMLGMSYAQMGENEKAEPLLEAAVRANPNDENAQMALARV